MEYTEKLRDLGYEVDVAFGEPDTDPENSAYRVSGHGISITLPAAGHDDEWERLLVPEAHEHRERTFANTHAGEDERIESMVAAALATETITPEQADLFRAAE